MRESCTYGSVRGALSNERPYRYGVGPFEAPLIDSPGDVRIGSMH